jgi:hypothetical protein
MESQKKDGDCRRRLGKGEEQERRKKYKRRNRKIIRGNIVTKVTVE